MLQRLYLWLYNTPSAICWLSLELISYKSTARAEYCVQFLQLKLILCLEVFGIRKLAGPGMVPNLSTLFVGHCIRISNSCTYLYTYHNRPIPT